MASPPTGPTPRLAPNAAGASRWQDLVAGLCVAGLLIPEAVAYAGLARLPAVHALSAAMAGLAIYSLFGRSRFAIVAPTSSTAVLSAAAAMSIGASAATQDSAAYATAFMALVLLAGVLLMLLAWARQGQLSAFVSRPVLRGFAFALAITIVIKQLPDAFGFALPAEAGGDPFHALLFAFTHVREWHGPTAAVALCAGALIAGLRRWPRLPASLLVIAAAIAAARWLDLHALGVAEVGAVERPGLHFELPRLPLAEWLTAAELAFGLVVLIFAESWGSMRTMALAAGDTLDADRELMVLGACNVGAALLQGMPVGAGFSATSANAGAGAGSRWAGVAALAAVALAVVFALPAVRLLPRPVLAVAVISALWHALSVRPLLSTWRMNRDRLLIVGAVAAVLLFGVLYGMLVAIALSVLAAMRRFSQPVVHELGELGSTRNFVAIDNHSGALAVPGLLVLRPEEPLFFACAERVASTVIEKLKDHAELRVVVLSLEESSDLDSTAAECLLELKQHLQGSGRALVLARVKDPVRELLGRLDPEGLGRADGMFWSVADAVQAARAMLASKEPRA
jgi:MFS superfamily sulfate permease-like transporter